MDGRIGVLIRFEPGEGVTAVGVRLAYHPPLRGVRVVYCTSLLKKRTRVPRVRIPFPHPNYAAVTDVVR